MLFVISGKARVGKDTFGVILKDALEGTYTIMAYADELKKKCMEDFDLSYEQLYGDFKEVPDKRYRKGPYFPDKKEYWTPREILQFMGTDCYRKIDNNFWVKSLIKRIKKDNLTNVIITDARFPNEIDIVKDLGAFHIRVLRDNTEEIHGKEHASEISLNNCTNIDFTVYNNKSIPDLYLEAKRIIDSITFLK